MNVLVLVGVPLLCIVLVLGLIGFSILFWEGLTDGADDARITEGYDEDRVAKYAERSLDFNPIVWHGWYVGFYGGRTIREWWARNNFEERSKIRRQKAMIRREDRRRKVIDRRAGNG